jgi:ATP-binding cassette subfamily B protein/subfamily B ATP-binding cassette protein MsbA
MVPSLFIHKYFNKKISEIMTKQIVKHKLFNSTIMTSISATKEIRYYQCEDWIQNRVTDTYTDYVNERLATLKERYTRGKFFRLNTALGITLYFALAAYGFHAGQLEINDFVASLFFCTTLIFTLNGFVFNVTETIPALEYVKTLREIFDLSEENIEISNQKEISSLNHELQVNVEHFSYGAEKPVLMNLDFKIRKGEKVIFVGASGAGKTTLLKLIANMYQSNDATILWDFVNYKEINQVTLRQKIGFMFQETYLFGKSIYENIRIGNPEASADQIYEAAQKACVDSFAKNFPKGYETNVGERGTLLSGGQMQRIAIARLILKNPDIIILDEITANLDSETEKLILDNIFHEAFPDKTIIAVSHKTAVLQYFDRFLYVNESGIKEIGKEAARGLV